jgi:hypothetical protein
MTFILKNNEATVFMNKFTVLAKNKQTYFVKRLTEELGQEAFDLFDPWSDSKDYSLAPLTLIRTTGVYGDDKDLDFLKGHASSSKMVNSLKALEIFRSKRTQYFFLKGPAFLNCRGWIF